MTKWYLCHPSGNWGTSERDWTCLLNLRDVSVAGRRRETSWLRGFQAVTGLVLPTVIAGALYRSANLYHPRRRAILHIKSLKKSKKQKRDFEQKPPYFEFEPLKMRSLQVLMASAFVTAIGTYTPFVLLVSTVAVLRFVQMFRCAV